MTSRYQVMMIQVFHTAALLLLLATINGFNIHPRIIKGTISKPSEFKFFVFFDHLDLHCSASLISDR